MKKWDNFYVLMLGFAVGGVCGVVLHAYLTNTLFTDGTKMEKYVSPFTPTNVEVAKTNTGGFSGFARVAPKIEPTKTNTPVVVLLQVGGHHTEPPPNWKLETDGKQWRWIKPDGDTWLPLDSRQEAIDNAWEHYEYREPNWKPAK